LWELFEEMDVLKKNKKDMDNLFHSVINEEVPTRTMQNLKNTYPTLFSTTWHIASREDVYFSGSLHPMIGEAPAR